METDLSALYKRRRERRCNNPLCPVIEREQKYNIFETIYYLYWELKWHQIVNRIREFLDSLNAP